MLNPAVSRHFLVWVLALLLCSITLTARGQASGADGEDFLHRVQAGDTLIDLAARYTTGPDTWRRLQSLNDVGDPTRLPIGKVLRIPFSMIPQVPAGARVIHVKGQVLGSDGSLQADAVLNEAERVSTGPDGHVTLELEDGSTLSVPPSSVLSLIRLRAFQGTGLVDIIAELGQGSLESSVAPGEQGVGRFEVRTPVSITGVRGTRLRVHVAEQGSQSEVVRGMAHVRAGQDGTALLRQNQGSAIDRQGRLLGVHTLLPAPELGAPERGARGWELRFPEVEGAVSYLVKVSTDPEGLRVVSRQSFSAPEIHFSAHTPGLHYVHVRGIDALGIGGHDASLSFPGAAVLRSGDGGAIRLASGGFVQLQEY